MPELHRAGAEGAGLRARHHDAHPRQGRAGGAGRVRARGGAWARLARVPRPAPRGVGGGRPLTARTRARRGRSCGTPLPKRPPAFCTGCPERPVFSALKIAAARSWARPTWPPTSAATPSRPSRRSTRATRSWATAWRSPPPSAVAPAFGKRVISIMGDGGFWHNGLTAGVASAVFNKQDSSCWSSGERLHLGHRPAGQSLVGQEPARRRGGHVDLGDHPEPRGVLDQDREPYRVADISKVRQGRDDHRGRRAQGDHRRRAECQLERQRRVKPETAARLKAGERVGAPRFGVDPDVCTGDQSCMRLNGCPSLTLKPSQDPLRDDPVAHVDDDLRRLRALRRGGPRRGALPVVLRGGGRPQPGRVGPRRRDGAAPGHRLAPAGDDGVSPPVSDPDRRPRRAGRRRAHRVDRRRGAHAGYPCRPPRSRAWPSAPAPRPTTSRSFPSARGREAEPVLALSRPGRRGRAHRLRVARGGPHDRDGLRVARPHDGDREHASALLDRREVGAGRRDVPARGGSRPRRREAERAASWRFDALAAGARARDRGQRAAARRARGQRVAADDRGRLRGRDPRRAASRWTRNVRGLKAGLELVAARSRRAASAPAPTRPWAT